MSCKDKKNSIMFYCLLVIIWQLSCVVFEIKSYILPAPSAILMRLVSTLMTNYVDILVTFTEAILGIGLGFIIAICIGVIFNEIPFVKKLLLPLFRILQMIPIVAIAPLFAIWFGFTMLPKIILIAIICAFPILINLISSFEHGNQDLYDYLKTLKPSKYMLYKHYYLNEALPNLYAALNIAITYSVITALFTEYMGSVNGLGLMLNIATSSSDTELVFVIIVIVVFLTQILLSLNKKLFKEYR